MKPDVIGLERDLKDNILTKPDVIGLERELVRMTF
jgi:hypothetical protein